MHSEWSWDALAGSMEETCRRAVEIGLPSVAFTEHADLTPWIVPPDAELPVQWHDLVTGDVLSPPPLDLDGFRTCLDECRGRFPELRILSGVELSEPHWHDLRARDLLACGAFERVLASVHSAPVADGDGFTEVGVRFEDQKPAEVLRGYLAETVRLIEEFDHFEVLAHIDFPVRRWPMDAKPFDPTDFEDEFRLVLRRLAASDRILEFNTRVPLDPLVLGWWRQEGGQGISFASDAHEPQALAREFATAVHLAEAAGFRPGRDVHGFWTAC
nr:PHP domain-containing protein [Streptacidiphilus melanogenes]